MKTIFRLLPILAVSAQCVLGFNHSEIEWNTVVTNNFTINYYDKTKPAVYAVWKIAEETFQALAPIYNYRSLEKICISIAEHDDFSNGSAEWTSGNILIWLPDARFDLRSNNTWLRNVVTHEMAHIMSLEQKRAYQLVDIQLAGAITSPNEAITVNSQSIRISTYPSWLAEGISQLETEVRGNDAFDSRREMLLRSAVLSNSMLTLDEMGNFNHDMIGNELVYNQGFAFCRYLAGQVGLKNLRSIFVDGSSRKINFTDEFRSVTGLSLQNVYSTWIDSLRAAYHSRYASIDETFATIHSGESFNSLPKYSPDGKLIAWFSSGPDDGDRTDLCIAASTTPFTILHRIKRARTAFCFSDDGSTVYFVKAYDPNRNGSSFNDLYAANLSDYNERRITRDGRIYDVCAVPRHGDLLCVTYSEKGYGLYRCNPQNGTLTPVVEAEAGNPVMNASVNPSDPSVAVVSRIVNGQSRLFLCSLNRPDSLHPVSPGGAQEESPFWAPDGRIYFSADYDGVFNIYSLHPDGTDLALHTRTKGGYFSPVINPQGTLTASHYENHAFSIVSAPLSSMTPPQNISPRPSFKPLPVPKGTVDIKEAPYNSRYRRGVWEGLVMAQWDHDNMILPTAGIDDPDQFIIGFGLQNYQNDALHKKERAFGFTLFSPFSGSSNQHQTGTAGLRLQPDRLSLQGTRTEFVRTGISTCSEQASFTSPLQTTMKNAQTASLHFASGSTSDDESGQTITPNIIAVFAPSYSYENSFLPATLGLSTSALLIYGFFPYSFSLQSYVTHQLSREWAWGGLFDFYGLYSTESPRVSVPFFLQWTHTGYINQDFGYNTAGLSRAEFTAAYINEPGVTAESKRDSATIISEGWMTQLSASHAVPINKYSSLEFSADANARFYNKPCLDTLVIDNGSYPSDILDNESDVYLLSAVSARFTFPIQRTIDKGLRHYFDALYGTVAYTFQSYTNGTFFTDAKNVSFGDLFNPDIMPGAYFLDQRISVGLMLGSYTSYLVFSPNMVTLSFSLLRNTPQLTINLGF